jgi:prepilin-type processing-associated H-X9-DG protein
MILPYVEQANLYNLFDFTQDVNAGANNATARVQQVPFYICPSDISVANQGGAGKSNYFGNLGAQAYVSAAKTSALGGMFFYIPVLTAQPVAQGFKISDITDGMSNTALFAEIVRGNNTSASTDPQDVRFVTFNLTTLNTTYNLPADDITPPSTCTSASPSARYAGLQYYRDLMATSLYTHTRVPNSTGGDCLDLNLRGPAPASQKTGNTPPCVAAMTCDTGTLFAGHITSRSYHSGGVNVCFGDGSVRFVRDSIALSNWIALGTRANGETLSDD